jgi:DNA-binding NarL/FixJ family response regulator
LLTLAAPPQEHDAAPPRIPEHRIPPYTRLNEPSPREKEILKCLILGYTNKVIARHLGITEATVKVHLKNLLKKLHAENRTQAAIWAFNAGYADENADPASTQPARPTQTRD